MAKDPVCGKEIPAEEMALVDQGVSKRATKWQYRGQWHYFCSWLCRTKFIGNPDAHMKPAEEKR